jgi:hypothetical protein
MSQSRLLADQANRIVALDSQPVLRNLLITQCYHDLSSEIARVLGAGNANWCTYATWASKTAGRFIRNDEVPALFRKLLEDSHGFRKGTQRVSRGLFNFHPETSFADIDLFDVAEETVGEVSGQITAGNLKVFSELAPVFARFVHLFDGGSLDKTAAQRLLDSLKVGPSSRDGQSLLKEALEHLLAAAQESDPVAKAQHMLVANAQTGLHEQIRLQPYIAGSLNAPIENTLERIWHERSAKKADESLLGRIHALWDRLGTTVVHDAKSIWNLFSAEELMTLTVPGQVLRLGDALPPAAPGRPLYPEPLVNLSNYDAIELLEQYDALDTEGEGYVGASDWTLLTQRMRYIIALFRSRQQESSIQQQPFSPTQLELLWADKVPPAPL